MNNYMKSWGYMRSCQTHQLIYLFFRQKCHGKIITKLMICFCNPSQFAHFPPSFFQKYYFFATRCFSARPLVGKSNYFCLIKQKNFGGHSLAMFFFIFCPKIGTKFMMTTYLYWHEKLRQKSGIFIFIFGVRKKNNSEVCQFFEK